MHRINGFISRSGANGLEVLSYSNDVLGRLPSNSQLFDIISSAAELIESGKSSGFLCGSTKEFKVTSDFLGRRQISVPIPGFSLIIKESKKNRMVPFVFNLVSNFAFNSDYSSSEGPREIGDINDPTDLA